MSDSISHTNTKDIAKQRYNTPYACMQRNLVISPAAASSSIEITEIDLGSSLFAYMQTNCCIQQFFHCCIKLHAI